MQLAELVSQYRGVRLATPGDNARILAFFEQAPMHTSAFDVQYRRRPDFFRLLRYQSDRAFVLVSEDEHGSVRGVGTVSLRPGWIEGRPTTIGYVGDLRVAFDRALSRTWRKLFADIVNRAHAVDELADCTHWFTTVIDDNRAARAALTRETGAARRSQPREQPVLVPIAPFTMRNLILRLPGLGKPRSRVGWQLSEARAQDLPAVTAFFEQENRRMQLGFRGELVRRLSSWDGLSISDFVYAVDEHGILACVAPWSPGSAKQTVVSHVPATLRMLGLGARLLPSTPVRVPQAGEALRMLYLTHLTFAARLLPEARAGVFRSMLDRLFDRARGADWHAVALCDFHAWNLGGALRGFIQRTVPITVYEVVPHGRAPAAVPSASPPAFEMAMV